MWKVELVKKEEKKMNKKMWSLSLFIIMLMSSSVFAGDITKSSLEQLMSLSGLNKQIAEYPKMINAGMNEARQTGAKIPNDEFDAMQLAVQSSFKPKLMLAVISAKIKKETSESEAKELLNWYKSDVGRAITKAEEDATTPSGYQNMISQAQTLFANKKSLNYALKMESLLNATDMAMKIQNKTSLAVYSAITKSTNPYKPIEIAEFKKQMDAQEEQMRANMKQFIVLSFIYSYKDLDFAMIEKYIAFLEKDKTKKFNQSIMDGIESALEASIEKFATSLAAVRKKFSN